MENNRIPYNQEIDYRFIKHVRIIRNKTQMDFGKIMGIDASTVGKLERNELAFTPAYHGRFKDAMKRLRVSNIELSSIRKILEMKEQRGYK